MVRRKRLLLLLAFGLVVCAAFSLIDYTRDREPTYQGRQLSDWIIEYQNSAKFEDAHHRLPAEALRNIGTNELPFLVKRIAQSNPKWVKGLGPFARRVGLNEAYRKIERQFNDRLTGAVIVFELLGTNAVPAIPALTKVVVNRTRPDSATCAIVALTAIGPAGIAALESLLKDPANPNRREIMEYLVNALPPHNGDTDAAVREYTANTLVKLAPDLFTNKPAR